MNRITVAAIAAAAAGLAWWVSRKSGPAGLPGAAVQTPQGDTMQSPKATTPKKATKTSGIPEEGPTGTRAYKAWLVDDMAPDLMPGIRAAWDTQRLAQTAILEARAAGVPPEIVWGVIWRESGWKPVGPTTVPDKVDIPGEPDKISTALGVGQITRTRWREERKRGASGPTQHWHLFDPATALRLVAESYARGAREHDTNWAAEPLPAWIGYWWAGNDDVRAARKRNDIAEKGGQVWALAGDAKAV